MTMTTADALPEVLAAEPAVLTGALVGYARVSTSGQLLDRQLHALTEVGCIKVFADKQSGRDADRPDLAACLKYLRAGDTLVVPSLDRLARSLQDLITIVGELRRAGVGFRSLHEALDTTTPGGRLVFHIFAALAEFVRELIVEGTHEGLAAAKARGVRLGRPPAMTPEQVRSARDLLTHPDNTVSSVARLLGVSRSTIYKHVPDLSPTKVIAPAGAPVPVPASVDDAGQPVRSMPDPPRSLDCPTCGYHPTSTHEVAQHREELDTVWLFTDAARPGYLVERWHCSRCQPHQVEIIMCGRCGITVMLGGGLAAQADQPLRVPQPVQRWLTDRGWHHYPSTWECGQHSARQLPLPTPEGTTSDV
jgi:DNA invertase Pin-like site-specific DNA recombinase